MALSSPQLFKLGFLARCIDENLSVAETNARAQAGLTKLAAVGTGTKLLVAGLKLGAGLPFLAAAVGGAGLGFMGAKLTEHSVDPEAAKRQELAAAYQQYTAQAQRERWRRLLQPGTVRRNRMP